MVKVKLVRSLIGVSEKQRRIVRALGLKRLNSTITHKETPAISGMIFKVKHLLEVKGVKK